MEVEAVTPLSLVEVWVCQRTLAGGEEEAVHTREVQMWECVEAPTMPEEYGDEMAEATLVGFADDVHERSEWKHVLLRMSIAKERGEIQR